MVATAVLPIARTTFDLAEARRLLAQVRPVLDDAGFDVVATADLITDLDDVDAALDRLPADLDLVLVVQATFADASMTSRIEERTDAPIVCWSFPEPRTGDPLRLNALCGANLAAYTLRRRGSSAAFVHVDPSASYAGTRVREAADRAVRPLHFEHTRPPIPDRDGGDADRLADRAIDALDGALIGVIGDHPTGFDPCSYDPIEVAELTGAATDRIELDALFGAAEQMSQTEVDAIEYRVASSVVLTDDVREHGLDRSLRLYGGLRSLRRDRGWSAIATRCWPECTRDFGGAICAPQAMTTADGYPAMCEADVLGAVTALALRAVAGADPFVTDVVDIDRSDDTSAIWHCGQASLGLADERVTPVGIRHPMQDKALLHEFPLRPGRVTVARLTRARGEPALVIGGGELLERPRPFAGTCGVLRWDRPIDDVMGTIFEVGLDHHVGVVAGDHEPALVELAARWDVPVIRLGIDRGTREPAFATAGDIGP